MLDHHPTTLILYSLPHSSITELFARGVSTLVPSLMHPSPMWSVVFSTSRGFEIRTAVFQANSLWWSFALSDSRKPLQLCHFFLKN